MTPEPRFIVIERKANQRLEPTDTFRQRIKVGSPVTFRMVPPLTGLVVRFGNRSPFAVSTMYYDETYNLTAPFDATDAANNVYKFDCEDPGTPGGAPSINGGEVEILP